MLPSGVQHECNKSWMSLIEGMEMDQITESLNQSWKARLFIYFLKPYLFSHLFSSSFSLSVLWHKDWIGREEGLYCTTFRLSSTVTCKVGVVVLWIQQSTYLIPGKCTHLTRVLSFFTRWHLWLLKNKYKYHNYKKKIAMHDTLQDIYIHTS